MGRVLSGLYVLRLLATATSPLSRRDLKFYLLSRLEILLTGAIWNFAYRCDLKLEILLMARLPLALAHIGSLAS